MHFLEHATRGKKKQKTKPYYVQSFIILTFIRLNMKRFQRIFSFIHYCSRLSMFSTAKVFTWCVLFPWVPNETLNIFFRQINTSYQGLSLSLSWTKWYSDWFSFDRNSPHGHSCECYRDNNEEFTNPILKVSLPQVLSCLWENVMITEDYQRLPTYIKGFSPSWLLPCSQGERGSEGLFYNTTYTSKKFL